MNSTQILTLCFAAVLAVLAWTIYRNWKMLVRVTLQPVFVLTSLWAMYLICNLIADWVWWMPAFYIVSCAAIYTASGKNNQIYFKYSGVATIVLLLSFFTISFFV